MTKVFIDGSAGTTGLRIRQRLSLREDLELLSIPEQLRKDDDARKEFLNKADVAFLCLPDAAAIAAVEMVENPGTVVIDTSTAHRTSPDWVYGFPELSGQREKLREAKRIANPGCHASGFIALEAGHHRPDRRGLHGPGGALPDGQGQAAAAARPEHPLGGPEKSRRGDPGGLRRGINHKELPPGGSFCMKIESCGASCCRGWVVNQLKKFHFYA